MSSDDSERPALDIVRVAPITEFDLPEVGRFLGEYFPPATPGDQWAGAWRETVNLPGSDAPNHGYLLRAGGRVVGAYPAIYSTRMIDGQLERFCNLAVWCVAPEYRAYSARMGLALLGQPGLHFTDLTPIDVVQKLNLRLGFKYFDTTTAVVPNLPLPPLLGKIRVSDDPAVISASVAGPEAAYYRDHAGCRWARHLVVMKGDQWCYLQWRKQRRKNLRVFASIDYVSNGPLFRAAFRAVGSYLLFRHGVLATLTELRVVGGRIFPSVTVRGPKRMFRSSTLRPEAIDYLYSEITSAP